MRCPYCSSLSHGVIDKRTVSGTGEIRRRRQCLKCNRRFTTYERIAQFELVVIKKDGRREPFSREKLRSGVLRALEKSPSWEQAESLVEKVERSLRKKYPVEVMSKVIGRMVLLELRKLDPVAYLRFASVYRQFNKVGDFAEELEHLETSRSETKLF